MTSQSPDNIYIHDSEMNDPIDDPWHEARTHRSNDGQARYVRHDLYAAVDAERDELLNGKRVVLPVDTYHASAMFKLGYAYLEQHSPESLRDFTKERDELRTKLDDLASAAKMQMCAQGNEAECWDGLHSCCKPELRDAIMRIKAPKATKDLRGGE